MGHLDDADADDGRHETPTERLDRNWDELLQELRVAQTGVQILAGFLLTLPFQQRFTEVDRSNRVVYLVAFSLAIAATAFLVAPVSAHRLLFRRRAKASLVRFGDRCARAGLGCLALSVSSVTFLIFDVVAGVGAAVAAAVVAFGLFLTNWVALPLGFRRGHPVHDPRG
jgi:hypothetical protein